MNACQIKKIKKQTNKKRDSIEREKANQISPLLLPLIRLPILSFSAPGDAELSSSEVMFEDSLATFTDISISHEGVYVIDFAVRHRSQNTRH